MEDILIAPALARKPIIRGAAADVDGGAYAAEQALIDEELADARRVGRRP